MKTTISKNIEGKICISTTILRQAGLSVAEELELHISESMIVVTKKQMSANELRIAVDELMALGGEFNSKANEICAGCDGEDCPYLWDENDDI